MSVYLDVDAISKKQDNRVKEIEFFSESALKVILAQPDRNKKNSHRDLFFMILMYDTGAWVQEILDLWLCDIRWDVENPYIIITGKGVRIRHVPIMEKTCRHLDIYFHRFHAERKPDSFFILTAKATGCKCPLIM